MSTIQIYDATKEEQDYIDCNLIHFNNTKVPFKQELPFSPINRCIRDGNEIIGGINAQIYCWNILCINALWIKDKYRNKGYASALINDVERKAKERNCKISHLDTFDFQAKDLYEKLGYSVFGVLQDCPEGHNRYYMSKKLV